MISGRTRLHVVANGTMTGQRYIDEVLLPHVRLFRGAVGDKFVFMDDNATCYRTLAVQDCLDSEVIQRLVWPARSPDLNPIENVWDALGRQVAGRNYPPTNKNTLIRTLTEEWDKLPQQLLDNVVQSMPSSCLSDHEEESIYCLYEVPPSIAETPSSVPADPLRSAKPSGSCRTYNSTRTTAATTNYSRSPRPSRWHNDTTEGFGFLFSQGHQCRRLELATYGFFFFLSTKLLSHSTSYNPLNGYTWTEIGISVNVSLSLPNKRAPCGEKETPFVARVRIFPRAHIVAVGRWPIYDRKVLGMFIQPASSQPGLVRYSFLAGKLHYRADNRKAKTDGGDNLAALRMELHLGRLVHVPKIPISATKKYPSP
ncbi:transposable element Tcb2 transposase [Trichonephila clavipes]|nr:transposable element Tcb2 transposase [Trichonephila clavipes]